MASRRPKGQQIDSSKHRFAAEVAAVVANEGFDYLDVPIERVTTPNVPIPYSPVLEKYVIPDENKILETVKEIVL